MAQNKIANYAFLSDMHTCALVSNNGAIDWFPLPKFDSPSFFTKLLGKNENGFWSLALENCERTERRYLEGTKILISDHYSETGMVQMTDFLALDSGGTVLVRHAVVKKGRVKINEKINLRNHYGVAAADRIVKDESYFMFQWEEESVTYCTTAKGHQIKKTSLEKFHEMEENEEFFAFVVFGDQKDEKSYRELFENTKRAWCKWSKDISYDGPRKELVLRSALTLKALTYEPTGSILAAPTTSLPEVIHGERNWDYRYSWLRDSVFTVWAFSSVGHHGEANTFFNWALNTVANDPEVLSVGYTIEGNKADEDKILPHLDGFEGSTPVRIGNSGLKQTQLDVYGEFIACIHHCWHNKMIDQDFDLKTLLHRLVNRLLELCDEPDRGIWEMRGESQFYTYSQAMAWVGLDKGYTLYSSLGGTEINEEKLTSKKNKIYKNIFEKGVDPDLNCFTQSFGSTELDAANLRLSLVGFIDANAEIMVNTVNQTMDKLYDGTGVRRYTNDDGLKGKEGYFLTCSFWLVENLAFQGRISEANKMLEDTIARCNDLGLLSEEVDEAGNLLGNFPQAFSHIGLINAFSAVHSKKN